LDQAGRRAPRRRELGHSVLLVALAAAALLLMVTSTDALGATLVTPKCDNVNLRTGPSTTYTRKAQVDLGARLTVVATVSGGGYTASCAGAQSGTGWYRISAVNGRSSKAIYGVTYVYGAKQLFKTLLNPTPSPSQAAAPVATATPTAAPTAPPPTAPPPTAPPSGPTVLGDSVTFYGRGYGHGVGLSQYGAEGRAADGQLAGEILAHYYRGTTLGTMGNPQIRVLVLQSFAASASNPVVAFGRGGTWTID